jgi:deoxycytidylate deaminase
MNDLDDAPPPMRAAINESKKSKHRFRIGAAIARGKRVLSKAHNSRKTHPVFGSGEYSTLHAESYAIYRAVRQGINLEGTTIYIYRHNNNLAKPCPCCMGLIHKYGIKDVVYSGAKKSNCL